MISKLKSTDSTRLIRLAQIYYTIKPPDNFVIWSEKSFWQYLSIHTIFMYEVTDNLPKHIDGLTSWLMTQHQLTESMLVSIENISADDLFINIQSWVQSDLTLSC